MSNCKNKEGGTHHFACDCREESFKQLTAECDSLRAELQAEQKARRWLEDQCLKAEAERDALRAENEKLREENRRLKACPICHKDFIGNRMHVNCGDMMGSAGDFSKAALGETNETEAFKERKRATDKLWDLGEKPE